MKDPADRAVRPRARGNIPTTPPGTASPTALAHSTEDRELMPEEGQRASRRLTLRTVHPPGTETICSSCSRDLGAPDLNYRLVLRCTSIGRA